MSNSRIYEDFESISGGAPYLGKLYWYNYGSTTAFLSTLNVTESTYNWRVSSSSYSRIETPYQDLSNISSIELALYNVMEGTTITLTVGEYNGSGNVYNNTISVAAVGYYTLTIDIADILASYPSFDLYSCLVKVYASRSTSSTSLHLNSLTYTTNTTRPIIYKYFSGSGITSAVVNYNARADDLLLLYVENDNRAVTTPSGWTQITGSPQYTGTAGGTSSTRLSAYYKVSDGTDTSVTATGASADHTVGLVFGVWNADPTTPINTSIGEVAATSTTSVSYPSVTSTKDNTLVMSVLSWMTDATSNNLSSTSNSSLDNLSYFGSLGVTTGDGGGFSIVTGYKQAAGLIPSTTATLTTSSVQAKLTSAINGYISPGSLTLSKTLDNATLSSTSTLLTHSALSKTLDSIALNSALSTGTTLSKTLDNTTLSSASTLLTHSELSKTLDNATLSSTSTLLTHSALSKTLDSIQVDLKGSKVGSVSSVLANATLSSTSTLLTHSELSKTLDNINTSSIISQIILGSLSKTLDNITVSFETNIVLKSSLSKTLDNVSAQSLGVPWLYRYGESNITLDSLACSSSEYIDILFDNYFTPLAGYEIYHINVESTKPEIIYYSQNYAGLYDTQETSLGSYGETPTFKVLYNVMCTFRNILNNNITYTEKKLFKTDIKPNWSAIRDSTLKSYFEGTLINNMTPAEFIDYMKSQGYYQ